MGRENALIVEHRVSPVRLLESDGSGTLRFEAVVSEADYVNGNRRLYPREVLWPAFEALLEKLARHPGLVDHPGPYDPSSVSDIGIVWEHFWMEGNLVMGRGRVVPTQRGKDLQAAMEAGVEIGFSTRGYGYGTEEQLDGKTITRMESYKFDPDGSVDAVINPSVRHARLRGYAKEDQEKMENELKQAAEALEAAQAAQKGAEAKLGEAEQRAAEASARADELAAKVAELEKALADREAASIADKVEAKLLALTSEHRFGAAIRTEVKKLAESGIQLAPDNIATYVAAFAGLVESAATASAEGAAPRGDLSTHEDAEPEEALSAEKRQELMDAGLL